MFEVRQTSVFARWIDGLRDKRARARVLERVHRLSQGLVGDAKSLGGGLHELRVHYGPGYRVYFKRRGDVLVLLLCGGHKTTQDRDIARAYRLAEDEESSNGD